MYYQNIEEICSGHENTKDETKQKSKEHFSLKQLKLTREGTKYNLVSWEPEGHSSPGASNTPYRASIDCMFYFM